MADDLGDEWWTQGDNSGNIDKHLQLYFAGNVIQSKISCVVHECFKIVGLAAPVHPVIHRVTRALRNNILSDTLSSGYLTQSASP